MGKQNDFLSAQEVAELLGVSKSTAYAVIKKLNAELSEKGHSVLRGRVVRSYLEEKYGIRKTAAEG